MKCLCLWQAWISVRVCFGFSSRNELGGDGDGVSKFPGTLQPPNPARFLGSIPPNQALSEEEGMNQGRTSEESAPVMGLRPKQRWARPMGSLMTPRPNTTHHKAFFPPNIAWPPPPPRTLQKGVVLPACPQERSVVITSGASMFACGTRVNIVGLSAQRPQ